MVEPCRWSVASMMSFPFCETHSDYHKTFMREPIVCPTAAREWVTPPGWRVMGNVFGRCKDTSCRAAVAWYVHRGSGRRSPFNADGVSHFATCPGASGFRRSRVDKSTSPTLPSTPAAVQVEPEGEAAGPISTEAGGTVATQTPERQSFTEQEEPDGP